jgi:hypothetical protein
MIDSAGIAGAAATAGAGECYRTAGADRADHGNEGEG